MIIGILLGFGAALAQSCSYLFSRRFVAKHSSGTLSLLVLSHVIMGALSAVILPFVWPDSLPPVGNFAPTLLAAAGFYFMAQGGLFMALRSSDASRVSPLLGLKLVMLPIICVSFLGRSYTPMQWLAVVLAVFAAWCLNRSGGKLSWRSVGWILFTCLGYSLSDLNIKSLVGHFDELGLIQASLVSAFLCYVFCGLCCLPGLLWVKNQNRDMWKMAFPFAVAWLIAMLCLFGCFGSIGVVFGNIVQSTRGLISIILGALIAKAGYHHLETKLPGSVLVRRLAAAMLMLVAIALFSLG